MRLWRFNRLNGNNRKIVNVNTLVLGHTGNILEHTTQRRSRNGWFYEECQRITDEENVARSRMLVSETW